MGRKKDATGLTLWGAVGRRMQVGRSEDQVGKKSSSTGKQRECQGQPVLAAATFGFWSVLWGLPARLVVLAVPVQQPTIKRALLSTQPVTSFASRGFVFALIHLFVLTSHRPFASRSCAGESIRIPSLPVGP